MLEYKYILPKNDAHKAARITNAPDVSAAPSRRGHSQSIFGDEAAKSAPNHGVASHPTGGRRETIGRFSRAARPPVALQSVRNSREMYLRGSSSSASAIPLAINRWRTT